MFFLLFGLRLLTLIYMKKKSVRTKDGTYQKSMALYTGQSGSSLRCICRHYSRITFRIIGKNFNPNSIMILTRAAAIPPRHDWISQYMLLFT